MRDRAALWITWLRRRTVSATSRSSPLSVRSAVIASRAISAEGRPCPEASAMATPRTSGETGRKSNRSPPTRLAGRDRPSISKPGKSGGAEGSMLSWTARDSSSRSVNSTWSSFRLITCRTAVSEYSTCSSRTSPSMEKAMTYFCSLPTTIAAKLESTPMLCSNLSSNPGSPLRMITSPSARVLRCGG